MKRNTRTNRRVDLMFRAFSDGTRLRILYLLHGGERCVGDIVEILRIEQPSASRHLAYLRKAGLVVVRREAQWSHCALAPAREPFHEKLLECLACCFREVPAIQADQARAKRLEKAGGCCPTADKAQRKEKPKIAECCAEA